MPKIALIIADGSEEMESVIIADTLRRAKIDLSVISLSPSHVTCSRGIRIIPDAWIGEVNPGEFDVIILPGGMGGTNSFMADERLLTSLQEHAAAEKLLCAICAAPLALQAAGLITRRHVTCHPSVKEDLYDAVYTGRRIERDGNILTSQGPGTAMEFALEIISIIEGTTAADQVREGLVL